MAPRVLALVACAVVAVGVMAATAAPARAEFCRPTMPDQASDATGYTFEAQVVSIRTEWNRPGPSYITMAVSRVFANRDSGRLAERRPIELMSNLCDGFGLLGLRQGDEVLMSTAYLEAGDGPSTWNTAVWRRHGEELGLFVLRGEGFDQVWFTNDRRIADAKTIGQALALVAPAAIAEPDGVAEPIDPGNALWMAALLAVIVAGVVAVLIVLPSLRERNDR